jgi:hypothetical protein
MKFKHIAILLSLGFLGFGCIAPRLNQKIVKYDSINRSPTLDSQEINIYSSRSDIDFNHTIIAAEIDFGYEPIDLLKKQARKIGGIGLLELKRENGYSWSAKVIVGN